MNTRADHAKTAADDDATDGDGDSGGGGGDGGDGGDGHDAHDAHGGKLALGALGALGIVFGDIGTSPLYAMRETFNEHHLPVVHDNVYGVLSVIFWSLLIIITVKYLALVMRADNHGEGGIMTLTSLVSGKGKERPKLARWVLILLGVFGAALLYGDGIITPSISVLAAVEGVEVTAPGLAPAVVPIAIVILIGLFSIQSRGTGSIGKLFGPIMVVWFLILGVLGISHIAADTGVFSAMNPMYGIRFFANNSLDGFLALGSMFLVVTGGEALYADMGHFGRRPIQLGWYVIVLPCLLLNYFGQGALLLADPEAIEHPFFAMAPSWGVLPLTALATIATVIASQALISGVFSLTMQAAQMTWLPRVQIRHTSAAEKGQIYIPAINWALLVACVILVLGFRTSGALAAAYGLAVTATMLITTVLFYVVAREKFGWPKVPVLLACCALGAIDAAFLGANVFKIPAGGWFPLVVAGLVFTLMTTWRRGRQILDGRLRRGEVLLVDFLNHATQIGMTRVEGTAVYLYSVPGAVPSALAANVRHNRVIHENLIVVSIETDDQPHVPAEDRSVLTDLAPGATQVVLHYGFMDTPDVVEGLREGDAARLVIDPGCTTYFLGAEHLVSTPEQGMARWREKIFLMMSRNATPAAQWFNLPADEVMTVGVTVEI